LQLIAVALVTPVLLIMMTPRSIAFLSAALGSDFTVPPVETQSLILTGAYLIMSLGVTLTESPALDSSATYIRRIAHMKDFSSPTLVMVLALMSFCLCAAGLTALALLAQPRVFIDFENHYGWSYLLWNIWSAAMSIGIACFGANAYATLRALQW